MMNFRQAALGIAVGFGLFAGSAAHAAIINGSDFTNGLNNQVIGGLTWTSTPGNFVGKTVAGYTGVGITGGVTGNEIDIGETLAATGAAFGISSITFGVLFDGPEFGDVQEVIKVSIDLGGTVFTLTTTGANTAVLSDASLGTVTNLSPADQNGGGVWRVDFAPALSPVTSVSFTALPGACGAGSCNNQSDFTLVQVVTVPEPATLALLGAGLLGLGLVGRARRRAA